MWIPVDCACGSGLVAPYLNYQHKFVPEFFAVSPEHLIFSHLPVNPEWQLLNEAISLKDHSGMISPSIPSLSLGIQPLVWAEVINIHQESPTTTLKIPVKVPPVLQLSIELTQMNEQDTKTFQEMWNDCMKCQKYGNKGMSELWQH